MPGAGANRLTLLLQQSLAGDVAARNQLLGRLRPYLQVLIRSWLGPDAGKLGDSDLVQESLLKAHQHLDDFCGQESGQLLAWVRRIAYHTTLDRLGKLRPGGLDMAALDGLASRELSPLESVAQADEVLHLLTAIERLSRPRQAVLRGRFFEGLSFREIAARMNQTEGQLRVLCRRALKELRGQLEMGT